MDRKKVKVYRSVWAHGSIVSFSKVAQNWGLYSWDFSKSNVNCQAASVSRILRAAKGGTETV